MPVTKSVVITLDNDKVNIDREGVTGEEMVKVIASLLYDMSNNIDASMADIAFDSVNYGINVFTPVVSPEGIELEPLDEDELDPQTDTEDADMQD